jgi:hypothetical protein
MTAQIFILILSGSCAWFVTRKEQWKRWGYIFGLSAQPFWFYSTITHEQWGMVLLCCWYTYCWGQGIYNYWIKIDRR